MTTERMDEIRAAVEGGNAKWLMEHSSSVIPELLSEHDRLQVKLARLEGVLGHDDRKAGMAAGGGSVLRTPNSKLLAVLERYESELDVAKANLELQGNFNAQMAAEVVDLRLKVRGFEEVIADWHSATGHETPASFRVERDKALDAAIASDPVYGKGTG